MDDPPLRALCRAAFSIDPLIRFSSSCIRSWGGSERREAHDLLVQFLCAACLATCGKPYQAMGKPYQATGKPYQAMGKPYQAMGGQGG